MEETWDKNRVTMDFLQQKQIRAGKKISALDEHQHKHDAEIENDGQ